MNKENLKAGDVELDYILSKVDESLHLHYPRIMTLIKSQQSRIDLLESAIREFLKCDLRCELSSFNHESCEGEDELRYIARTNLEKLMENKS